MTDIVVEQPTSVVQVRPGAGAQGPEGPPGPGVPAGGGDGDVVVKDGTDPYVFTTVGPGTFVQSVEATEAEALAGTSTSTVVTPRRASALITYTSIPPSGDTTGATDTAAIQTAFDAASSSAPSHVGLHPGTYYVAGLELKSYTNLTGAARALTVLALPNGADTDLIVGDDFATLTGGTTQGGPHSWSLRHLTLHGNRANNATGWCLRVYGRRYEVADVLIRDGSSGGFWSQWGSGGTYMGAHIDGLTIWNNDGNGVDFSGPQDSVVHDLLAFNDIDRSAETDIIVNIRGLAQGSQFSDVHVYGYCDTGLAIDTPAFFTNTKVQASAGASRSVHALSDYIVWNTGWIAGTNVGTTEVGLEIGDGSTAPKGCRFTDVFFSRYLAGSDPILWTDTNGYNEITGTVFADVAATAHESGTRDVTDRVALRSPTATTLDAGASPVDILWLDQETFNVSGPDRPVTTYPVMRFDAAALETATRYVTLPADWRSYTARVVWTNGGAGSGDVKWFIGAAEIAPGAAFGAFTTRTPIATTAPAGSTETVTLSGAAWSVTTRRQVIRLQRDATGGTDTLTNDANVLGVELIRAS